MPFIPSCQSGQLSLRQLHLLLCHKMDISYLGLYKEEVLIQLFQQRMLLILSCQSGQLSQGQLRLPPSKYISLSSSYLL